MYVEQLFINENDTLVTALKKMDIVGKGILLVQDGGKLLATLTDGDVRRWILSEGDLNSFVKEVAHYHPRSLHKNEINVARKYMRKEKINAVPIVDGNNIICDVVFLNEDTLQTSYVGNLNLPVVIMAGGLGTRLYPYTKILPKPLIPIGDIPITEHIINRFRKFGCKDFYLIVNYKKNMIKAYYNEIEKDYNIYYIDEKVPLGTGGGVGLLRNLIKSSFILTNCDTLIDEDYTKIVREHKKKNNAITMICSLKNFDISYGVVEIGENGSIAAMKEKPQYSFFTNTGTYIVEPEVVNYIKPDEQIGFPDVIQRVKDSGKRVGVYPINEKAWLDMGQFDSMEEMRKRLEG